MPQTICDKCGTQWGGTNYTSLICPICHHDAEVNKLKSDNWRLNDLSMSLKSVMREMREEINDTQAEVERLREALSNVLVETNFISLQAARSYISEVLEDE